MTKTRILIALFYFISLFSITLSAQKINLQNIEIVRDEFGVPHIFSQTNQEAIYGIAWAQCEDNFNMMQENLAIANGMYGKIKGPEGAAADFLSQILELDKHVANRYERDITPEIDGFLTAYTRAVNRYAELHPKELMLKDLFPVKKQDILKGYIFSFLVASNAVVDIAKVATNKMDLYKSSGNLRGMGSNAMAYNKNITDGRTYLVGNPHQPTDSPASFWETSVHTKEGYEMFGVTFAAGGVVPAIGTNRHLGWTHTVNYEDYCDVYQLKMHPSKKNHYEFDGEWLPLEERSAKLKVKIGPTIIPVKRKYYISKFGPTIKNKSGYFSIRSNVFFNLRFVEQHFKMGAAKNFDEFWEAMKIQGLPSFTVTYADKDQNIFHISNGILPKRSDKYDWKKLVVGNSSDALWSYDEMYPLEALPQVKNPACGYLFNCNNTALDCTDANENLKLDDFPSTFGMPTTNTHRANRFKRLVSQHDKITFKEVRAIREDTGVNKDQMGFRSAMNADAIPKMMEKYPEFDEIRAVFEKWDGYYNVENKQAAVMSLISMYLSEYIRKQFALYDNVIPEEEIVKCIRKAKKFLLKNYGTLEVELGRIQKIERNGKELPMYGCITTLANAHFAPFEKKKIKIEHGDTYIIYAQYEKEGLASLQTINIYGNSNKPDHPHHTSQMDLYVKKQVKTVELDVDKIKANAVSIYHPK